MPISSQKTLPAFKKNIREGLKVEKLKDEKAIVCKIIQILWKSNTALQSCIYAQALTEVSADVDVEVDGVVPVVHQVATARFDQRAEVMLLPVRIEHVAGHLDTEEGVGLRMVWQ